MFPCACDTVLLSFVCSRSVCLDSAQTSTETGTTTGRRTIWLELSDTQESMMEIMNIMSPSCWQTSTKSECLKADDTKPICAVGWPPIEPRQSFIAHFPFEITPEEGLYRDFQRHSHMNSSDQSSVLFFTWAAVTPTDKPTDSLNNQRDRSNTATCFRICNPNANLPRSEQTRRQEKMSCQQACYT